MILPCEMLQRNAKTEAIRGAGGGGQNSSSGGEGECAIAFGVLIEPVFPERVQAPTAVNATQGQNVFRAGDGPEHAGLFAASADHRFATRLHHPRADEIARLEEG